MSLTTSTVGYPRDSWASCSSIVLHVRQNLLDIIISYLLMRQWWCVV